MRCWRSILTPGDAKAAGAAGLSPQLASQQQHRRPQLHEEVCLWCAKLHTAPRAPASVRLEANGAGTHVSQAIKSRRSGAWQAGACGPCVARFRFHGARLLAPHPVPHDPHRLSKPVAAEAPSAGHVGTLGGAGPARGNGVHTTSKAGAKQASAPRSAARRLGDPVQQCCVPCSKLCARSKS